MTMPTLLILYHGDSTSNKFILEKTTQKAKERLNQYSHLPYIKKKNTIKSNLLHMHKNFQINVMETINLHSFVCS